jgi:hypothetical protein
VAFTKGEEKKVAKFLFENGLYYKIQSQAGTYFNGFYESGSTIYIGSHDNMQAIAKLLSENLKDVLQDGAIAYVGEKKIRTGSGSDIEVEDRITARFDVQKTKHGMQGDKKYAENGLPSWTGLGGIPILSNRLNEANDITRSWNKLTPYQRNLALKQLQGIYIESKEEIVKDFGQEFVFGKNNAR